MNSRCVIAFGGNLGHVDETFRMALAALQAQGFTLEKMSDIITTEAEGCENGAPDFRNAVAVGVWKNDNPFSLLAVCQKLEAQFGRPNDHAKSVSRTLDLDLILFGELRIHSDDGKLILPHPRAKNRRFVTVPLSQVAPELLWQL